MRTHARAKGVNGPWGDASDARPVAGNGAYAWRDEAQAPAACGNEGLGARGASQGLSKPGRGSAPPQRRSRARTEVGPKASGVGRALAPPPPF